MLLLSHLATVEEQQGRDVTLLTLIAASMETASVFNISSAQRQHSALKRLFLFDFVCLVSKKKVITLLYVCIKVMGPLRSA